MVVVAVIVGALVFGLKRAPATKASVAVGGAVAPSSEQAAVTARSTMPGVQDRADTRSDAEIVHLEIAVVIGKPPDQIPSSWEFLDNQP